MYNKNMQTEKILLITKDAFCKDYLPIYGNKYWKGKTPNIDELALKGTIFNRFYTAAPSSAMSYLSMFTFKYPMEQNIKTYKPLLHPYKGKTLFDEAYKNGYECHIVWDEGWMKGAYKYSECYGEHTFIHALNHLNQSVGVHYQHKGTLLNDNTKVKEALKILEKTIIESFDSSKKQFYWIHIPHVIYGRTCYGSDMDIFDSMVGILRKYFDDSSIFISGDHGNMNGHKGKLCYGFDVYESAICIPLISPKINNQSVCNIPISNTQIYNILFSKKIDEFEFIYSDSAYYGQPNRKLAIIKGNYKYIFNNRSKNEELYDLDWDPNENFNLINDYLFDSDRKVKAPSRELYFYPNWGKALEKVRNDFRKEKKRVWREGNLKLILLNRFKNIAIIIFNKFSSLKNKHLWKN